MGANTQTVKRFEDDLKDYTDSVAAVFLLKEVLNNSGAMITVGAAKEIVDQENLKKEPKIGNVVKQILAKAGLPGKEESKWTKDDHDLWHLEAAITIGGAVYTVDLTQNDDIDGEQQYTVKIESKLAQEGVALGRGKLFFNPGNAATVKLTVNQEGDLSAVTKKGLAINAGSFTPYPYQNEVIAKFSDSLHAGNDQRLALMGTGSGKSIIMAGVAQAVGRTVQIVPDAFLVDQQTSEVQTMLGAGVVYGKKQRPTVFTMDTLKAEFDYDWDEELSEEEILSIQTYFKSIINETAVKKYDQIVLQAEHPLFKIIAGEITDCMVLMDESHRHTFNQEDTAILATIKERNSVLALTATPTTKLYDIFAGAPLDDLSLGAAIELGKARPVKPEVDYLEAKNLIDEAVTNYFNDYYLSKGMNGYVNPIDVKKQIITDNPDIEDSVAQKMAIDKALELNRVRTQRNMAFSDDGTTRSELATIYNKIAEGDEPTLNKYQAKVAGLRKEAEVEARLAMELQFGVPENLDKLKETISQNTPTPEVDLKKDISIGQQKDIQRTINSFAIALVFGEKADKVAELDRTNKLGYLLSGYDAQIAKFDLKDKNKTNGEIPLPLLNKFKACETMTRKELEEKLSAMGKPITDLPEDQKSALVTLILDRAEHFVENIKTSKPIADIVIKAPPVDLKVLGATEQYASTVDVTSDDNVVKKQVAQVAVGIKTHVISDQRIATGVSLKDVLNVQIINTYSPVVESDPNVINGTLSGPQAAGRCVRNDDGEARAQQYIDKRYENKGLILTVDAILHKESGVKTKAVMTNRDELAKQEIAAATSIQSHLRAYSTSYTTKTLFNQHKPELTSLTKEIDQLKKVLEKQQNLLKDGEQYLHTTEAKLSSAEKALEFIPGNKKGNVPPTYRNDPEVVKNWMSRKLLPKVIHNIKEKNSVLEDAVKETSAALKKLEDKKERIIESISEASQTSQMKSNK